MNPSTHFTTILLHQFLLQSTHSPPRRVKYDFESTPNCDFTTHCEDRHNVWSYLYFVMHLRNKETAEGHGQRFNSTFAHDNALSRA